ncbi:MAG: FecR domain-containing protein [Gammaproteobacteria bacterium]|nr:FecR domain-containing protein [Gammaproteobacteria bacterium]MCW8909573.1 FecR domain-containing protein [Gammaproteobacteria bacterium]
MMNTKTLVISVSAALGLLLLLTPAQAEVINNTHWLIKSGDTVYSIARQIHPNDVKKQIRFRRELVKANPDVFAGNSNLMSIGNKLVLPSYMTVNKPAQKTSITKTRVAQKVATPDPEDVIGKVVINIGDLKATNRSATRRLSRHSEIISGDTIKTAKNTRAQIRMKDGALISLQPDTEFKIAKYTFNGKEDGTERGIYELIKGGFRTITGLIGHRNKQNYQVRTTVATIGIRGTHYGLMLCEANSCAADNLADGLYGGVVDGSVAIDNGTGQQLFNNDQYFHVASAQDVPVETLTPPPVFDGALLAESATQNNDKQELAESQTPPLTPAMLLENSTDIDPVRILNTSDSTNLTFTNVTDNIQAPAASKVLFATNQEITPNLYAGISTSIESGPGTQIYLKDVTLPSSQVVQVPFSITDGTTSASISGATLVDGGTDTALKVAWGRWSGNFDGTAGSTSSPNTNQHLHFVYSDNITPPAFLGGLTSSTSHRYIGTGAGTLPTDTAGGVGSVAGNLDITMDFVSQVMTQYTVTANTPGINVDAGANNVAFSSLDNFTINDINGICTGCSGQASVAFIGPQAEAVASTYTLSTPDGSLAVSGSSLAVSATGVPQ